MRTLLRYTVFQIPGLALVGALLAIAVRFEWLGTLGACVLAGLWLLKDAALYPFLRDAYEGSGAMSEARRWRGQQGRAREDLNPAGYVLVAGELWRAEAVESDVPIHAGERICVEGAKGSTLKVRRIQGDETLRST